MSNSHGGPLRCQCASLAHLFLGHSLLDIGDSFPFRFGRPSCPEWPQASRFEKIRISNAERNQRSRVLPFGLRVSGFIRAGGLRHWVFRRQALPYANTYGLSAVLRGRREPRLLHAPVCQSWQGLCLLGQASRSFGVNAAAVRPGSSVSPSVCRGTVCRGGCGLSLLLPRDLAFDLR